MLCVNPQMDVEPLHAVKWHPQQPDLVAVASDTSVYITDAAHVFGGELISQSELHRIGQVFSVPSPILVFDFDVTRSALATISEDSTLMMWNICDKLPFWSHKIRGNDLPSSLTFMDGSVIVGRKNGTVFQLLPVMGRGEDLGRGAYFDQVVEFSGPKPTIHFVILTTDVDPQGDEAHAACVAAKVPELGSVAFSLHTKDLWGQPVTTHRASIVDPTPNEFHLSDDHAGLYLDEELDPDEPRCMREYEKTPELETQQIEEDSGELGPVAGALPQLDQEDESAEADRPMEDDKSARSSARSSSGSKVAIAPVAVDNPQMSERRGGSRGTETTSAAAAAEPSLDTNRERKSGTFTQARSGSAPHHHKHLEDTPDGTRKNPWTKMSKAIAVTSRRTAQRVTSRARQYCEKLKGLGASGWMP
ncbi:hypothetical protein LXA43DRAFT_1118280 [Ganoderma leucocontextum]|nr:hypothetical protein LXA43DRAFT_1118280 [Ganoderma leucocontextum]